MAVPIAAFTKAIMQGAKGMGSLGKSSVAGAAKKKKKKTSGGGGGGGGGILARGETEGLTATRDFNKINQ